MNKISQQLKAMFSRRGKSFSDEIASAIIDRAVAENFSIDAAALADGAPSEQAALLLALAKPLAEVPFLRTGVVSKGVAATGSVVFSGVPTDGQTLTINDGNHSALTFEFDEGTKASGTLTFSGQPSDTNSFTLADGVTTKVIEFDSGVAGVASTGAVITLSGVPTSGSEIILKRPNGSSIILQWKRSSLADEGKIRVYSNVSTAALAAKELIAAINSVGAYVGNGVYRYFSAATGGSGVVNISRAETGAGNETISSGVLQVETATAAGTITTSGNVSAIVTGAGIAGSPLTTPVAVVAGTLQVETATVAGTIDVAGAGNATVIVTAAGMAGSPITVSVAVANNDTASQVATKIRAALALNATINAFFTIGGATTAVILTRVTKAANDATLNISIDNGTCTGLTTALTSANTTAGVVQDTATLWAAKVRAALGGVAAITALYTVGGSGTSITLTAVAAAANDATLNLSLANGTSVGVTAAPSSVDTTAGFASGGTVSSSFSGGVTAIAAGTDITAGHVGSAIGSDTAGSCTNAIAAINSVTAFLFTAVQGSGTTITLRAKTPGTAGNAFTMAKSGSNLAVSAGTFAGGQAAGSGAVGVGHTAVAIGATANLSATALHTAINGATLDVDSTNSPAGTCALANSAANGALGNHAIVSNASHVVVTGMSGGVISSAELISDEEVGAGRAVFISSFVASVGSDDWSDATALVIEDNDAEAFVSMLQAALVGDAVLFPGSADVTAEDAFKLGSGGGEGKGLRVKASSNEETGSDVTVTVSGLIKQV